VRANVTVTTYVVALLTGTLDGSKTRYFTMSIKLPVRRLNSSKPVPLQ
jgi:hypothetical protein